MSSTKQKYYAVKIGYNPGIYNSWEECKKQVLGYPKAQYKSFKSVNECNNYLNSSVNENYNLGHKMQKTTNNIKKKVNIISYKNINNLLHTSNIEEVSLEKFRTFHDNGYEKYYIFTDGSNQKSHTAYGVYFGNGNPTPYDVSPTFTHFANLITYGDKTNNIAELRAIQSALFILENNHQYINKLKDIVIISDSQYSIKAVTEWYKKWQRNGWLNSTKQPVANREIIEDILEKLEKLKMLGLKIYFKHQLAHTSKPNKCEGYSYYLWFGNYMIDYLVQKAIINK